MAVRSETREIDGFRVEVTQFPARKALEKKFQLLQLIGKPLGTLLGAINLPKDADLSSLKDLKVLFSSLNMKEFGGVLEQAFNILPPAKAVELLLSFFTMTKVAGKDLNEGLIDLEFAGDNLGVLYKIFAFVLEVNYKGFLGKSSIFNL